jgi:taurine-pyruvate aminotransferase
MPEMNRVYISNSGSEANEKAYKMVRALGHIKHGGRKKKILYRDRDYHGTTIAALSSTGQPQRREWFGPFVDGFTIFPHALCYRCAYGKSYPGCDLECARSLEEVIRCEGPDEVGAVIVEPITAGGGIIPPVPEYYDVLQGICRQYGVLLIMDEVVCGMGRTGEWFGYNHYGASPDIVTMAKGLASAYMPISMTVTTEEVFQAFIDDSGDPLSYFRDISTYGGCAGACAAALENIRIIEDEDVLANVRARGEQLMQGLLELKDHPHVGDVRGKGLLAGFEMVEDKDSKTPLAEAKGVKLVGDIAARGVLVGRTNRSFAGMNNTINLAPALVATADDIQAILEAISASLEAM